MLKKGRKKINRDKRSKKTKIVKELSPTTESSSTLQISPKSPKSPKLENKLFEYEGKLYAVGSIVSVGYGPYLAKKKKQRKAKKVKLIPESVVPVNEEHENVHDGDDEEGGGEEGGGKGWQGEYGADKPIEITSMEEGGSDEDAGELILPVREAPKRKKAVWEHELIFKEKDVDVLEGEALKIAKEMGLPYKKSKFVTEPIKYKVIEHDLRYKGYDKYIVSEETNSDGTIRLYLKPYSPPRVNKIKVFDGDFLPPPVPKYVAAEKEQERTKPPENYKGPFRLGDRITFSLLESKEKDIEGIMLKVTDSNFTIITPDGKNLYSDIEYKDAQNLRFKPVPDEYIGKKDGEIRIGKKSYFVDTRTITSKDNYLAKLSRKAPYRYVEFTLYEPKTEHFEGVIMDYGESAFIVSVFEKGMRVPAKTVEVSYHNRTINKINERSKIKNLETDKINVAEDYLNLFVETSTRINATKRLFQSLADLLGNIYESPVDTDEGLQKLSKNINWGLANSELRGWKDYYDKDLHQYMFELLYSKKFEGAPSFADKALEEYESTIDPILIIDGLLYVFGDIFNGNGARCLSMMSLKAKENNFQPTIIDISIRRELTKLSNDELENLSGARLAGVISHIIATTIRTNPPPNPTDIELRMKNEWAVEQIENHIPTKAEKKRFDSKYMKELKTRYSTYEKEWKMAKLQKKEYKTLKKTLEKEYNDRHSIQQIVPRLRLLSVDGKQLSEKGMLLADEVSMLEEKLYIEVSTSTLGSTNKNYLQKICKLIMFLTPTDVIGKYAKFFRSKLTSDMYDVNQLDAATQFHMIPEFFANTEISDNIFDNGMREIELNVDLDVIDFINIYILGNPPRIRDVSYGLKFMWEKYVKDPAKTCGGMRMKVGADYRGVEDAKNYDCERGKDDMYVCKAKLEPITDDDLILCYNEELHKFTCASINDVLYALWDEDQGNEPINPMTGRPYGDDFMRRMRDRYEDLYDKKLAEGGGFTKRIMKFKASEDRLLFGGSQSEEIEY